MFACGFYFEDSLRSDPYEHTLMGEFTCDRFVAEMYATAPLI